MILQAATPAETRALNRVLGLTTPRKRPKYGNTRVYIDGYKFDSKLEAKHYVELKLRQDAGEISKLTLKPKYELRAAPLHRETGPVKICSIIPDFEYIENGIVVTCDTKGMITADWKIKAKIFAANYGREIVVVRA